MPESNAKRSITNMGQRVLTPRELNRTLLARQMLLERANISILEAIERLVGLQAQTPNAPYIGLWTRLAIFQRNDLVQLLEQHKVVRATLMRSTLHLVTAKDYLLLRPALQPALTRALYAFFGKAGREIEIEPLVSAARAYIEEKPRTFTEIRAHLTELNPDTDPALMAYVVRTHLPLVQIPPGGAWNFAGSPAHDLAERWLGQPLATPEEGFRYLVFHYLAAFGPATVRDIQAWSGLTGLRNALEELRPGLCTFRDEQGNELFDLPDMPLPSANTTAPVRFLPEFDNLILSHAERGRVVVDKYRSSIFLSAGRVRATFLVDGFTAGTWKIERTGKNAKLLIEPFETLSNTVCDELVEEGKQLLRFVEDDAEKFEVQFANK